MEYTIRKTCELTGAKVRTVRQWIHDGKINATKNASNRWMISDFEFSKIESGRRHGNKD